MTINCLVQVDLRSPIVHSAPHLAGLLGFHIFRETRSIDRAHNDLPIYRDENSLWHASFPLLMGVEELPERIPLIGRFEPRDLGVYHPQIQRNNDGNFPKWSAKKVAEFGNIQNSYQRFIAKRIIYSAVVTDMNYFRHLLGRVKNSMIGKRHATGGAIVNEVRINEGIGGKIVTPDGIPLTAIPKALGKSYKVSEKSIVAHHGWQLPFWEPNNATVCYVPPLMKNWTEGELACLK